MERKEFEKELLKKRILLLDGVITKEKAIDLREKLFFLNAKSTEREINLIIDTPGGEVIGAFVIYETLVFSRAPVIAIVNGECSSSGVLVLQGAKKRLATKSSFFYLHPFSISFEREPIAIDGKSEKRFLEKLKAARKRQRMFCEILAQKTNLSLKQIKAIQERIIFAKKAKELGLIDEVIEEYKI